MPPTPTETLPAAPTPTPSPSPPPAATLVEVTRVVDGDTIEVRIDGALAKVRLIGIDTPETVDPNRPVMCFGPEASARTTQMIELAGWRVELERDVSETDRYGRLLRYVWLQHPDGRRMLNYELVAQGYAQVSTYPPDVRYQDLFLQAQREARDAGRGLWSACGAFGVPAVTPTPTPVPAPPPAAPPAAVSPAGVTFVSVRGGSPGGVASVSVQTAPGAACTISYVTPAGTASTAKGLIPKAADGAGTVSWSWNIGTRTRPGTGTVSVTCGGASASAPITIG